MSDVTLRTMARIVDQSNRAPDVLSSDGLLRVWEARKARIHTRVQTCYGLPLEHEFGAKARRDWYVEEFWINRSLLVDSDT